MCTYLSVGNMILINFKITLYLGYMLFTTIWEIALDGIAFLVLVSAICWAGIIVVCVASSKMHQRVGS